MSLPQSLKKLINSTGSKNSHSAEKLKGVDPLGFFIIQFVEENQNNHKEDSLATSKNFGKFQYQKLVKPSE